MSSRDQRWRHHYRGGEAMPLRLPQTRSRRNKGRGEGDSESGSSDRILEGYSSGGYVIPREKLTELPVLHKEVWKGDLVMVKLVTKNAKKRGSDVNYQDEEQRTALHLACARGHCDIVNHLLLMQASITACDSDGCTPMHKALDSGHSECLPPLVDSGRGEPNIADKHGRTPLHLAAMQEDVFSATVLLERGAMIDAVEENGQTAVHIATLEGHEDFVACIIEDGADVNATDGHGRTALMMAASEGHIGLLKLLTESKADPDAKDKDAYKAIDYAISQNYPECARLIEDYERVVAKDPLYLDQQPQSPSQVACLISAWFGVFGSLPHDCKKVVPSTPEMSDISLTEEEEEDVFSLADSPPPKESGETQATTAEGMTDSSNAGVRAKSLGGNKPSDTEEVLKSPVCGRVKFPSLMADNPGMETGNPGMETGIPGMETGIPGMETGIPGMETGNPGMETGNPGVEAQRTGNPGMETGIPGMETGNPGVVAQRTGNPGMETGNPGMEAQRTGIPEGKSRVQLMKEMWESGAVFGREEESASEQEPLRTSSKGNISQRWIKEISRSQETREDQVH